MSSLATCPPDDGGKVQTHGSSPASAGSGISNITVRRGLLQYDKYLACKSVNVPEPNKQDRNVFAEIGNSPFPLERTTLNFKGQLYFEHQLFRTERHESRRRDPTRADGAQQSRTEEEQYPHTVDQIVTSAYGGPVGVRETPCADVDGWQWLFTPL
ncbi:hypothetical protein T12_12786 [Trichinella patagoniensis]|uniref:Uncharacterized protein n=1 Tax=Trichinella patagoniensis TaxID=990121 RepID=A0A0V0ZKR5_9BILA|nr:hypothetical protein T12_12786 [Trichinella patagoniensis]